MELQNYFTLNLKKERIPKYTLLNNLIPMILPKIIQQDHHTLSASNHKQNAMFL